ncbi:GTP-binding protein [Allofranklinella schreckenbergeri]|uniref:GTP-binding protein n=1 Tax=Allofranklinella schreckenbergeri TaxID=1076744 RepID=A0A3M6Q7N3_9BURK|nr:GTPase [Allofranklinella schreckenbergeri]RMW99173.1 GTP-binding protein [Allofranklinella schreckenbergeri]
MKMNSNSKIFEELKKRAQGNELSLRALREAYEKIKNTKINLLLVGGSGVGKSSTINAIFDMEKAKVGKGTVPETSEINRYELDNMVIWDTPGLGDSNQKDGSHKRKIINKLRERDENGNFLIDLVLLIVDGGTKDYDSTYNLIRNVVAPSIEGGKKECENRLLVAINKADSAMDRKNIWDDENNRPTEKLKNFLDEKVKTTKERIKESTSDIYDGGLDIECIYYSAGYEDEDGSQEPYNLAKLLNFILDKIPAKKRISVANDISQKKGNFSSNDQGTNYEKSIEDSFLHSFVENLKDVIVKASENAKEITSSLAIVLPIVKEGIVWVFNYFDKNKK